VRTPGIGFFGQSRNESGAVRIVFSSTKRSGRKLNVRSNGRIVGRETRGLRWEFTPPNRISTGRRVRRRKQGEILSVYPLNEGSRITSWAIDGVRLVLPAVSEVISGNSSAPAERLREVA